MSRRLPPSLAIALGIFAILAIAPIALLLLESIGISWFSVPDPEAGGFQGPSLEAYAGILDTPIEREQLWNTLLLGFWATLFAVLLGAGTAWLPHRTDLPGARWIGIAALLPILFSPILSAMAFAEISESRGLLSIGLVLAASHAPFTAALTARGLRSIDGRLYEASLLSRGRLRAELTLLRQVLPDILAGALLVLVFVISEHGVPEFLSVKGKPWRVYSEAVFLQWSVPDLPGSRRSAEATAFTLPLILLTLVFAWLCLRARSKGSLVTMTADHRPLPLRKLGRWKIPALGAALLLPLLGLGIPAWRMMAWTAGATANQSLSFETVRKSFRMAFEDSGLILYTCGVALLVGLVILALGGCLAWHAARRRRTWIEALTFSTLSVPAILLGVGYVRLWNRGPLSEFYESPWLLVLAFATRFLPLGVLALANAFRRLPQEFEEAALLLRRSRSSRLTRVLLPIVAPSLISVWVLAFLLSLRELDLSVMLAAGNEMAIRPISNSVHFGYEDKAAAMALILLLCAAAPLVLRVLATGKTGEATS